MAIRVSICKQLGLTPCLHMKQPQCLYIDNYVYTCHISPLLSSITCIARGQGADGTRPKALRNTSIIYWPNRIIAFNSENCYLVKSPYNVTKLNL